ncbi:MAG: rhomboid family intramembrane serine protease [Chloroflexi bacterium]|nr:rhomboid family intramembrane serine protease [Chloroflexota bacterium]
MRQYYGQSHDLAPLWYLLGVNIILFLVSLAAPGVIADYGLVPAEVAQRPWTVLTAMFLHAGFGHIMGNMVTLYFFGVSLAEVAGSGVLLVVYFVGGLCGNLAYVLLAPPLSIAVGASGAIFAVGGSLVALIPRRRVLVFPIPVPMPLWAAIVGGFFVISFLPGVAWQAHFGGLVAGLAIGYVVRRSRRAA